jgi:hypothetical protein
MMKFCTNGCELGFWRFRQRALRCFCVRYCVWKGNRDERPPAPAGGTEHNQFHSSYRGNGLFVIALAAPESGWYHVSYQGCRRVHVRRIIFRLPSSGSV